MSWSRAASNVKETAMSDSLEKSDAAIEDAAPAPALQSCVDAIQALTSDVEASLARLRAGRTDTLAADVAAISAGAAQLETHSAAWVGLDGEHDDAAKDIFTEPLERLHGAIAAHQNITSALQNAADALVTQAKREQIKRAGGGLYSARGATAGGTSAGGAGRVIGQL